LDEGFGHDVTASLSSFAGLAHDMFVSIVFCGAGDFILPTLHFYCDAVPVNH
jgi:hypothetical protein